jgi:hypothetical protein
MKGQPSAGLFLSESHFLFCLMRQRTFAVAPANQARLSGKTEQTLVFVSAMPPSPERFAVDASSFQAAKVFRPHRSDLCRTANQKVSKLEKC